MREKVLRIWTLISFGLVMAVIVFLFVYVGIQGAGTISWEFLTQPPRGAILGLEGGIWPAIAGSLCFTLTAVVLGGIPAVAWALYCRDPFHRIGAFCL